MTKPYIHNEDIHNLNAPREVVPIIMELIRPKSVLDVGCGTGTWLKVFEENGVDDYLGVDGDYVDKKQLKIPVSKFKAHDLKQSFNLDTRFDVVISLEVAEHLPELCADKFVHSLISHGEIIIFSAAVPGQGGQNHLNEQWPSYWQAKFAAHGYYFHDVVRPVIWNNEKVEWWYRQNIFLISKEYSDIHLQRFIHPDLYNFRINELSKQVAKIESGVLGVRYALNLLIKSFFRLYR